MSKPLEERIYLPVWFDAKAKRRCESFRSDSERNRRFKREEPWERRISFDDLACAGFALERGRLPASMVAFLSSLRRGQRPVFVESLTIGDSALHSDDGGSRHVDGLVPGVNNVSEPTGDGKMHPESWRQDRKGNQRGMGRKRRRP